MSTTITRSMGISGKGVSWSANAQYAYSGNPNVNDSMLAAETSIQAVIAIPYAVLAFIAIFVSTETLTFQAKTSGGVDVGTPITVTSTKGFTWSSDDGTANPFDANVAYFVVTKAATTADVPYCIEVLFDATT